MPPSTVWELTEADVRRLCRPAIFARAQALQRAGYVLKAAATAQTRRGTVRGTWRRLDDVVVRPHAAQPGQGRGFDVRCSCGKPGFCEHAGALLLHWVRESDAFAPGVALDGPREEDEGDALDSAPVLEAPPEDELAPALARDSLGHLREIARRRGVRVTAKTKAELVPLLAAALADSAAIDTALARLTPGERLALDAAVLVGGIFLLTTPVLQDAYHALGGAGEVPGQALFDSGLLVSSALGLPGTLGVHSARGSAPPVWSVPQAVLARLGPRKELLPPTEGPSVQPTRALDGKPRRLGEKSRRGGSDAQRKDEHLTHPSIHLSELLLYVTQTLRTREVRQPERPRLEMQLAALAPAGWSVPAESIPAQAQGPAYALLQQQPVRLVPAPLLSPPELEALAAPVGASARQIAFAIHLLMAMGVVDGGGLGGARLNVRDAQLWTFLIQTPVTRWGILTEAWLNSGEWLVNDVVFSAKGALQLRYQLHWYGGVDRPAPTVERFRRVVVAALGLLAPGTWYDVEALVDLVQRVAPDSLGHRHQHRTHPAWWYASSDAPDKRLDLESESGWRRVARPLLVALLRGPCTWLGFVETSPPAAALDETKGTVLVRVLPAAAMLTGRAVATEDVERAASVVLDDDLTVLVPAGQTDLSLHALLMRAGRALEGDARGLRYRLTADGVGTLLEDGWAPGDLAALLAQRAGSPPPKKMRTALEQWESSFGSVRLYDDVAVIELGDDQLLEELLETTSLGRHLVQVASARVALLDPRGVDELVAELTRIGQPPRVSEDVPRGQEE